MSPNTTPNADKPEPVVDALEMRISWAQDYHHPQDLNRILRPPSILLDLIGKSEAQMGPTPLLSENLDSGITWTPLTAAVICDSRGV